MRKVISGALTDHDLFKGTNFGPLSRGLYEWRVQNVLSLIYLDKRQTNEHIIIYFSIYSLHFVYAHLVTSRIFSMSVAKI